MSQNFLGSCLAQLRAGRPLRQRLLLAPPSHLPVLVPTGRRRITTRLCPLPSGALAPPSPTVSAGLAHRTFVHSDSLFSSKALASFIWSQESAQSAVFVSCETTRTSPLVLFASATFIVLFVRVRLLHRYNGCTLEGVSTATTSTAASSLCSAQLDATSAQPSSPTASEPAPTATPTASYFSSKRRASTSSSSIMPVPKAHCSVSTTTALPTFNTSLRLLPLHSSTHSSFYVLCRLLPAGALGIHRPALIVEKSQPSLHPLHPLNLRSLTHSERWSSPLPAWPLATTFYEELRA